MGLQHLVPMCGTDRRKSARVQIHPLGAHPEIAVRWPTGEAMQVIDLSHSGAALKPTGAIELRAPRRTRNQASNQTTNQTKNEAGQSALTEIETLWSFPGQAPVVFVAQVIRLDPTVALRFVRVSPAARLALANYLKEKLLGLSLKLVNPHYYGPDQKFSYWFQGPGETNVYLWHYKQYLFSARIELLGHVLEYRKTEEPAGEELWAGELRLGENGSQEKLERLSRSDSADRSWERLTEALQLLEQVQDSRELLNELIEALKFQLTQWQSSKK